MAELYYQLTIVGVDDEWGLAEDGYTANVFYDYSVAQRAYQDALLNIRDRVERRGWDRARVTLMELEPDSGKRDDCKVVWCNPLFEAIWPCDGEPDA